MTDRKNTIEQPLLAHVSGADKTEKETYLKFWWAHGKQGDPTNSKRLSIYVDLERRDKETSESPSPNVYAILTGPGDRNKIIMLKNAEDLQEAMSLYFQSATDCADS